MCSSDLDIMKNIARRYEHLGYAASIRAPLSLKYLGAKFGDLIEYLGIAVLLILCYWPSKVHHVSVTEIIKVLFLTSLLSIGAEKTAPEKIAFAAILILLFVDRILCDINANDFKANEVKASI